MRIQSKFKDYYDYISHRFGQDPDCVYVRSPIKNTQVLYSDCQARFTWPLTTDAINKRYGMKFIVVGPHVVPILTHITVQRLFEGVESGTIDTSVPLSRTKHEHLLQKDWKTKDFWPQMPSGEKLNRLIRAVGAPVFCVNETEGYGKGASILIAEHVPILKDWGFPSLFTPEVIWQDIYTTLTSVLRKDPDKAPPVEVSEKIRIEYAGFNLKTSFRHPVNQKKAKKVKKARVK